MVPIHASAPRIFITPTSAAAAAASNSSRQQLVMVAATSANGKSHMKESRGRERALGQLWAASIPTFMAVAPPALALQAKQAEVLIERIATGLKAEKVLDKITTVITGQTVVEPEILEKQLKAITEGEDSAWDLESLRSEFLNNVTDIWSTSIDLVSNFNPSAVAESAGEILGQFAERFAAWELSSLVALGERWLIWTPLVVLPMAWQMSKNNREAEGIRQAESMEVTEIAKQKQEKVLRELRRIELRSALLRSVEASAKAGTLTSNTSKQDVEEIVKQLERLGTMGDGEIDGNWRLVYASQEASPSRLLPQLPGLEITNLQQKLWQRMLNAEDAADDDSFQLLTQNSALVRLGPVGVVEVAIEGTWEQLRSLQTSLVSFNTFTARFVEILGAPIAAGDVPGLSIPVPAPLRQSAQWKLIYVDEQIRINEASNAQLYLFIKAD